MSFSWKDMDTIWESGMAQDPSLSYVYFFFEFMDSPRVKTKRSLSISVPVPIPDEQDSISVGSSSGSSTKFLNFFRTRNKSGSSNSHKDEEKLEKKTSRQRSKSVALDAPPLLATMPVEKCMADVEYTSEPLRIALAKKLSPVKTPMSQLLSSSLGHADFSSDGKVGPEEFVEMVRRRTNSDVRPDLRPRTRRMSESKSSEPQIGLLKPPTGLLKDGFTKHENPKPFLNHTDTKQDSGVRLTPDIPENSTLSNSQLSGYSRIRRGSLATNQLYTFPSQTDDSKPKNAALYSMQRRFSQPEGPNLAKLREMSARKTKISGQEKAFHDPLMNFPKFTAAGSPLSPSNLSEYGPLDPGRYVIWKEGERVDRIIRLPTGEDLDIEGGDDINQIFVKSLKKHTVYELMPFRSKLVLLDLNLRVRCAFDALSFDGVRAAPLWDSDLKSYVGMLTVTDFIRILQKFHENPDVLDTVEDDTIWKWREILHNGMKPMMTIDTDDSLLEAVRRLRGSSVHRLLVIDIITQDALYILTYRQILHFVWKLFKSYCLKSKPSFMNKSIWNLNVGTFDGLASVQGNVQLNEVFDILLDKRLSSIPIVDDEMRVLNIYGKCDVMNLVLAGSYKCLNSTLEEVMNIERNGFEGVYTCKKTDTLANVIELMVQVDVHRLIVVDDDGRLDGVVSLSDVLSFLSEDQNNDSDDLDGLDDSEVNEYF